MKSDIFINSIGCHAAGEIGEVIQSGIPPLPGNTIWEQSKFLEQDKKLRDLLLSEPRGGVQKHFNLLLPPKNKRADFGWIIMEPQYNPPMSGSNAICVTTVILETGMIPMVEPFKDLILEAPGGLINARAFCKEGKVQKVEIQNMPSFVYRMDQALEVPGLCTLKVSIAFGGDSFVIINANDLGFSITPNEADDLVRVGKKVIKSANEQIGFSHPTISGWDHISFCQFTLPVVKDEKGRIIGKNTVAIQPGKLDRSPCGTGCSARMALLSAKKELASSDIFVGKSILNTEFECRIKDTAMVGDIEALIPVISGSAWITGHHTYLRDKGDPFQTGYKLSDTWPNSS